MAFPDLEQQCHIEPAPPAAPSNGRRRCGGYGSNGRWAASLMGLVLAVAIGMVAVRAIHGPPTVPGPAPAAVAAVDLSAGLVGVAPSILDAVGRGAARAMPQAATGLPATPPGGRPVVLYIGAEYCPFCAAQRWPLAIALARFGTFSGVYASHSAVDDVYPATPTISFHQVSYRSDYLSFTGVETASNVRGGGGYQPMDTLTATQQQLLNSFDRPPYVTAASAGAIPFMVFGDGYLQAGASFDPSLLAGMSTEDVLAALSHEDSAVARAILGSANAITAALCQLTTGRPSTVCTSPAATAFPELRHGH
jgi:hypothetical protein